MSKKTIVSVGGKRRLTLQECARVSRENVSVALAKDAVPVMEESRKYLLALLQEKIPVYGVNTQFGDQANLLDESLVADKKAACSLGERQLNLVRSHCCGLGEEVSEDITRAAILLRAHSLGFGYSGVRPEVVNSLIELLNKRVSPVMYRYGSIGASGDLIPLAAIAHTLLGEDHRVRFEGKVISAARALKNIGMPGVDLEAKEGLALINGTSFMTAVAALAMYDLRRLFKQVLAALGIALETLLVIDTAYDPTVHELKRQQGEIEVNNFLRNFWGESKLIQNFEDTQERIKESFSKTPEGAVASLHRILQDYYSLRAVSQGFGPFWENLERSTHWIEGEMNSVNDNPIIDVEKKRVYHAANFMGYYVTEACDVLKMDIAQAATWLHAVLADLFHARKSHGLPINLVSRPDLYSGFRPLQILAASLAVQNRKLAHAQQSFMLPTEGDNQDVNSLGAHAAFDFRAAVENLEHLTAILLFAGVQAVDFRGVDNASKSTRRIYSVIRENVPFVEKDRKFEKDILTILELMRTGVIE